MGRHHGEKEGNSRSAGSQVARILRRKKWRELAQVAEEGRPGLVDGQWVLLETLLQGLQVRDAGCIVERILQLAERNRLGGSWRLSHRGCGVQQAARRPVQGPYQGWGIGAQIRFQGL